jgi:hypothetical protein
VMVSARVTKNSTRFRKLYTLSASLSITHPSEGQEHGFELYYNVHGKVVCRTDANPQIGCWLSRRYLA